MKTGWDGMTGSRGCIRGAIKAGIRDQLTGLFPFPFSLFPEGPAGSDAPVRLIFTYEIAGVAYEAAQDVTALPERLRAMRFDLPVQVRYDYRNPANSIVVAEEWSGIRSRIEGTATRGHILQEYLHPFQTLLNFPASQDASTE